MTVWWKKKKRLSSIWHNILRGISCCRRNTKIKWGPKPQTSAPISPFPPPTASTPPPRRPGRRLRHLFFFLFFFFCEGKINYSFHSTVLVFSSFFLEWNWRHFGTVGVCWLENLLNSNNNNRYQLHVDAPFVHSSLIWPVEDQCPLLQVDFDVIFTSILNQKRPPPFRQFAKK